MWKTKKSFCLFLITILFSLQMPVLAAEPEPLYCLALGDSIAKGFSCDDTVLVPYPELVRRRLESETRGTAALTNMAKNGLSVARFASSMLEEEELPAELGRADVVMITIGANDLIEEFKVQSQGILGRSERFGSLPDAAEMLRDEMSRNPLLVIKAVKAIAGWDYDSFEANFQSMMDFITEQAKPSAQIIMTNVYNPTSGLELPDTLNTVINGIIGKMNEMIEEHRTDYGYELVDLSESGIVDYVQADGLHPTQDGQQLIADEVWEKIQIPGQEQSGEIKEEAQPQSSSPLFALAGVCSMGITGILLIILGVRQEKGKKNKES